MLSRMCNFYPRPPRGGRLIYQATTEDDRKFLSTPSARRATWTATLRRSFTKFLSTPSARRATVFVSPESSPGRNFYPRPPRGGRRSPTVFGWGVFLFLSTPSARRATVFFQTHSWFFRISIHALREEGDVAADAELYVAEKFLSTPSARRATRRSEQSRHVSAYFYPRPPRGGRRLVLLISAGRIYFYPRPPRGGRPRLRVLDPFVLEISIHALREEGDDDPADDRIPIVVISIHALREEGDRRASAWPRS